MPGNDTYLETPAVHPRLDDAGIVQELAAQWKRQGWVRIANVLEPGLAAELAVVLNQLPAELRLDRQGRELSWQCGLMVPDLVDPQHPPSAFRMVRFLRTDLPALVASITGLATTTVAPDVLQLRVYRKGSYGDADGRDELARLQYVFGLTGAEWPSDWGGHPELLDVSDRVVAVVPPAWDTLDLIGTELRARVPLVSRSVELRYLQGCLAEAK